MKTNRTKLFFDFEFTGLHKDTTPISLGIATTYASFYAEFTDYDKSQLDDWLRENVIANLLGGESFELEGGVTSRVKQPFTSHVIGTKEEIVAELVKWLNQFEAVEMWGDCLAYDWVLFCDLFGHAFNIPSNVYYIPFDICTAFAMKGIDPDISREEFSKSNNLHVFEKRKELALHNAYYDACLIMDCHHALMKEPNVDRAIHKEA